MLVTFADRIVGEVQGVSYTVTREKAPLYTMGSADPRSFSRGKRGIAGSLIFLVFDRSSLLTVLKEKKYLANSWEVPPSLQKQGVQGLGEQNVRGFPQGVGSGTGTQLNNDPRQDLNGAVAQKVLAAPRYHDQILPFNLVISAANEYGHVSRMVIKNVEIMNCGSGMSIDDITTDESCTFVATSVIPWHNQLFIDPEDGQAKIPTDETSFNLPGSDQ
jgi:hypothetical protein